MERTAVGARAVLALLISSSVAACSDGGDLDRVDGGSADDGGVVEPDAAAPDSGLDGGVMREDARPFECDPFAAPASAEAPAALTGRMDVIDYDAWDTLNNRPLRSRVGGWNFFTHTIPVQPLSDGALFRGIALDTCAAMDILAPTMSLLPKRNIGTTLRLASATGTVTVQFRRDQETDGPTYRPATQADTLRLFDPRAVRLDGLWVWSTPGDASAGIRGATATVGPVEDFAVTPAFTATSGPMLMDLNGTTIRWTGPSSGPAEMAIVLGRALNPMGDGHYLICRPMDDGEFTISASDMAAFAPAADLAFSLSVTRSAFAAFCNEGVQAGAAFHALVYLGTGIVRP